MTGTSAAPLNVVVYHAAHAPCGEHPAAFTLGRDAIVLAGPATPLAAITQAVVGLLRRWAGLPTAAAPPVHLTYAGNTLAPWEHAALQARSRREALAAAHTVRAIV